MPAADAVSAGPIPDLVHLRNLLAHAAKTHRAEVLLLHPGIYVSGVELDVRPGLHARTVAIRPPPGSVWWIDDTCSVVAVPLAALRVWLRDREGA